MNKEEREEQKKFYEKQLCKAGMHSYDSTRDCRCLRCNALIPTYKNSNEKFNQS